MSTPAYTAAPADLLFFRPPTIDDLQTIHSIEAASYPDDEAATYEKLEFRIQQAPGLFLVAVQSAGGSSGDQIVGYACGTCSSGSSLTHETMSSHEPAGHLCCVHSVVVDQQHRRKGIASRLLKAYLNYVVGTTSSLEEVRLICKNDLISLYSKAGFTLIGPSSVEHGKDLWYEMFWRPEVVGGTEADDDKQQQQESHQPLSNSSSPAT